MKRLFSTLSIATLALSACGCATVPAPNYTPKYELIDSIRSQKVQLEKLALKDVRSSSTNTHDQSISLRGVNMNSPEGTYSKYIESALKTDFAELKILDQNSQYQIVIEVLKNDIDISGFTTGTGVLKINLVLTKNGQTLLEKNYVAEITFDSFFAGAEAIPAGQSAYPILVQELSKTILSDSQFLQAIKKGK